MLRAPDGGLAVLHDLHLHDAAEPGGEGFACAGAVRVIDKGELRQARGEVAEQLEDVGHGVVVERDFVVVYAFERPALRPAAVGKLRVENVVEPAPKGDAELVARGGLLRAGEEAQLLGGGAVVEGAGVVPRIGLRTPVHARRARAAVKANGLGPAAARGLKREHRRDEAARFVARKPARGRVRREFEILALRREQRRGQAMRLHLGIEHRLLGAATLDGAREIAFPRGPLIRRQCGDALGGDGVLG